MSGQPSKPEVTRGANGTFQSGTHDCVLDALPDDSEPVVVSKIADKINVLKTTANRHLNKLAANNNVNKKKFHEKRVV